MTMRGRRPPTSGGAIAALLLVFAANAAAAQLIRGRTTDAVTHLVVSGALVELRDAGGATLAQQFSSATGGFAFTAAAGRTYQLRIAAIGYTRHQLISVATDSTGATLPDIVLSPMAVTLPALHAMAGRRACGKSEINPETFGGLLESARTSLEVMNATVQSGTLGFEMRLIHTVVLRRQRDSSVSADTSAGRMHSWPVRSLPLDSLKLFGFQRPRTAAEGGGEVYYGPDLEVLFSDWFLDNHCFTLDRKRSTDDTVVIRFERSGKSGHVDVSGELVLDRGTLNLQRLTYSHRNLPNGVPEGSAGGLIRFREVSAGLWVPAEWAIWKPIVRSRPLGGGSRSILAPGQNGFVNPVPSVPMETREVVGRDENRGHLVRLVPGGA